MSDRFIGWLVLFFGGILLGVYVRSSLQLFNTCFAATLVFFAGGIFSLDKRKDKSKKVAG